MKKYLLFIAALPLGFLLSCGQPTGGDSSPQPGDIDYIPPDWKTPLLHYSREAYTPQSVTSMVASPGQFLHHASFSLIPAQNGDKLLGFPKGKGVSGPDHSSVLSLGMAGGRATLYFDPPIENHVDNLGGYEFIVYGNSFWNSGDPTLGSFEPGIIEVMQDENNNDLADDTWYLIKGGLGQPESLNVDYSLSGGTLSWVVSDASRNGSKVSAESWWENSWGGSRSFTSLWIYPDNLFQASMEQRHVWGVSDGAPTMLLGDRNGDGKLSGVQDYPSMDPIYFYTVPDTHGDNAIDPHSGGGNAVDLAWAVDPQTLLPVTLTEISWIRLSSATLNVHPLLGESSPEVDAVVRVRRQNP